MENMKKLNNLIDEINKLISTSDAEVKRLNDEVAEVRQNKYETMCKALREFGTVALKIKNDVHVATKIMSKYRECYVIRLHGSVLGADEVGVYSGMDCFLGYFHIDKTDYQKEKKRLGLCTGLSFDIDAIIDGWNRDDFEKEFIKSVSVIVERKAKEANERLEAAKKLHKKEVRV